MNVIHWGKKWYRKLADGPSGEGRVRPARPDVAPSPERWGICCSGGGVRSASYCLGALQVLREEGFLKRATFVSGVSGGSYIASAIASAVVADDKEPEKPAFAPGSPEESYLRNNSSYMAPDAAGFVVLVVRVVAGACVSMLLMLLVVTVVAWPASWFYASASDQIHLHSDSSGAMLNNWPILVAITAVLLAVASAASFTAKFERFAWHLLMLAVVFGLLTVAIPEGILLGRQISAIPEESVASAPDAVSNYTKVLGAGGLAALTAVLGALTTFVSHRRWILLRLAAFVAGPALVLLAVLMVVNAGSVHRLPDIPLLTLVAWAGLGCVLFALWLRIDLNGRLFSLNQFYRRRLTSAFFTRREGQGWSTTVIEHKEELSWDVLATTEPAGDVPRDANPAPLFPRLIVCAAANVTTPRATPPGRPAMPFVFTKESVGVPGHASGRRTYDEWRGGDPLTVVESVAMSGAAVSPLMGKKTIRAVRFLMVLTGLRLGIWMPNPKLTPSAELPPDQPADGRMPDEETLKAIEDEMPPSMSPESSSEHDSPPGLPRRPRVHLLLREIFGQARLTDPYVYVTDGGHFDNLGLVELLRRGCTTIFCLDGGGDPPGEFRALGEAVALARSELQVDVDIDPSDIRPDERSRIAKQGHVIGTLRFRSSPDGTVQTTDPEGTIVYCRAAVTKDAPWDVRDFARHDKRFPNHSTMDQLFTDEKFESYRALGAHTARIAWEDWESRSNNSGQAAERDDATTG